MSLTLLSSIVLAATPPPPPMKVGKPSVGLARFSYPVDEREILLEAEKCGFLTARLGERPTYRDLRVENDDFSGEKLACLTARLAMQSDISFEMPPPSPAETAKKELQDSARKDLEKLGLLTGIPTLESTGSLEALAPAIEQHCGIVVGSAIKVEGDTLSFDPDDQYMLDNLDKTACLLNVVALSGVTKFGFVGNEKARSDD